jgi:hypothetical protein
MYKAVDAVLKQRPDWRRTAHAVHYNLLLAERWAGTRECCPTRLLTNHQWLAMASDGEHYNLSLVF